MSPAPTGLLRCCVFGAGGVGGHMAVRLANAGLPVSVVARGANLEAIKARGLRLLLGGGRFLQARIPAVSDPAELGQQDILVISVKLASLTEALEAAQPLVHRGTRVVFAMNGLPWWFPNRLPLATSPRLQKLLDPDGTLARLLDIDQWVACVVNSANRVIEPGVIQSEAPGTDSLVLGFEDGREADEVVDAFVGYAQRGGYQASTTRDVRAAIWHKLLINVAISPVSTACDSSSRDVCSHPETRELVIELMNEINAVGRKLGIDIDADPEKITHPERASNHITSFLQDRRAGRPLEISNGILAVRELAEISGVAAPRLDTLARLMQFFSDRPARRFSD